ncbi:MAG TPA: hypothetical protein VGO11_15750 [Chthoniobacteraceae bacterium]|jgi:hypothetical protein|nr:hypothetical protein [Chthoniobacteraceae bacterium]
MSPSISLLSKAGVALLVVSLPLCAETPGAGAPAAGPAPAVAPAPPLPPDLQQALQMPAGPDQTKAVVAAARAWGEKDAKGYLTWALTLPPPLYGPVQQNVSICGKCPEVKAAADWLVQQDSPKVTMLLHGLMLGWSLQDMPAAEAWCLQLHTTRDNRYVSFFTVADALCRKDAKSAVAWTETLTPPDDRNAAIDGTVTIWIRGDLAAMTTWIKQLNPSDLKWAALVAARNWRSKDLTLAAWLDQLPLSAPDKAATLKGPYPDSYHLSKYQPAPVPGKP